MAYILVANEGYTGPTEIGGQTYTVITGRDVFVGAGDTVLIDDARIGSVVLQPNAGTPPGSPVTINFEPLSGTQSMSLSTSAGSPFAATVNVPDGSTNSNLVIDMRSSAASTINVGEGAQTGALYGSWNAHASAEASTINIGAGASVGQIFQVNNLSVGDNAILREPVSASNNADTITIGDGVRSDFVVDALAGDDSIIIGDNVDGTAVQGGAGNDYIQLGTAVSMPNGIFGGTGVDTLAMTEADADDFGVGGQTTVSEDSIYSSATTGTAFTGFNNITIVCFARGTLIETDRGAVPVQDLAEGDLVVTRDNGLQPVRWIGSRCLSATDLDAAPKLRPIIIRAGALGDGLPSADLIVSPQHRVLVRSRIAQKMFGTDEVLVAAKQLCQIEGINVAKDAAEVEYFHILFDRHEIVISNDAETESLFTGPEALKGVGAAAREEIFAIFPELLERDYAPVAARVLASGRMGRKLAVRHAQNGKPLVC